MVRLLTLSLFLLAVFLTGSGMTVQPETRPTPHGPPGNDDPAPTGFLFRSVTVEGHEYPFALYVPRGHDHETPAPLVLFLHGRGESGTDGQHQLAVGLGREILWNPDRWPFIVLFPQKPTFDSQWEDHLPALREMLDDSTRRHRIDPERVYLTGLSQGGHGCWTVNAAMPDTFAAMAPICGYIDWRGQQDPTSPATRAIVEAAASVPIRAFHGTDDAVVPAAQSEFIVRAVNDAGGTATLTLYDGVGHNSWDRAYGSEGIGAWFLTHRRTGAR